MIPCMKLKTRPVTTSQEPQMSTAARFPSVRAARRVPQSRTPMKKRAAGRSQEICVPISEPKSRVMPVEPHMLPPAPPPAPVPVPKTWPPTTLPRSLPVIRPRPL